MGKGWACIARMGGIGDNLVASSPLRALKQLGYQTEVLTSGLAHTVFLNNPFIDKLSVKKDGEIPAGPDWTKWFVGRRSEYDIFAHLSHSMEHHLALFPDQTEFWWRPEYRRKICGASYIETVHDIVGVPYTFGPLFHPTEEEKDRAQESKQNTTKGKGYIAWILAGSRIDKIYPWSSRVIHRIIKELNIPVMMFGIGGPQFEMASQIMREVEQTNSSFDGLHLALSPEGSDPGGHLNWPVRRALAQVIAADLVITPDTGFAWAAAFEPMPKILMASHASPENITKHWVNTTTLHADPFKVPCWPCHRLHNDISTCVPTKVEGVKAAACISDISVESVMQTVKRYLHKPIPFPKVAA